MANQPDESMNVNRDEELSDKALGQVSGGFNFSSALPHKPATGLPVPTASSPTASSSTASGGTISWQSGGSTVIITVANPNSIQGYNASGISFSGSGSGH